MAEKFVIQGGKPLEGAIEVRGYKNAAGAVLAACLLTEEECVIDNLPLVEDVFCLIEILKSMGVEAEWMSERKLKVKAGKEVDPQKIDIEKVPRTRISVLLIGPLLARFKNFKIPDSGGDKIGLRPISTHLQALEKLGARITRRDGFYYFERENLKAKEIILKEFSVTATENLMFAAVKAEGSTIIKGAACEPQVQDLGGVLKKMGAKIDGLGTHTIIIEGVENLNGFEHKIISDPIEAATFIVAGAITPGTVEVRKVNLNHLDIFLDKLEEIGVNLEKGVDFVKVSYSPNLKATRAQAFPYPGFPTDFLPFTAVLLTQAQGKSLIHDPLYESRQGYLQELRKMGADVEVVDPHRALIFGKTELKGFSIESWDIRAGASLIIAGLLAEGQSTINNIYQIDRGYEKIEERLQQLGADIKRVKV
ncbi:UDP-N-acetylglucosamine 1-carboxyvinyltransferase [Candidatus Parcubacteria bacterium]|nr:UDP-N-acetylglucosamine 1-carboxyvinyltransferase [Candidatus Parcubacteria bacterium]